MYRFYYRFVVLCVSFLLEDTHTLSLSLHNPPPIPTPRTHTSTYTYLYTHTQTHARTHTRTHIQTHTHAHIHTHTHNHTHTSFVLEAPIYSDTVITRCTDDEEKEDSRARDGSRIGKRLKSGQNRVPVLWGVGDCRHHRYDCRDGPQHPGS